MCFDCSAVAIIPNLIHFPALDHLPNSHFSAPDAYLENFGVQMKTGTELFTKSCALNRSISAENGLEYSISLLL
jgi:hypothetical protein